MPSLDIIMAIRIILLPSILELFAILSSIHALVSIYILATLLLHSLLSSDFLFESIIDLSCHLTSKSMPYMSNVSFIFNPFKL